MKTCDRCKKETETIKGGLVWIDGRGGCFVGMCPECYKLADEAGKAKLKELGIEPKVELPPNPAPPPPPVNGEAGDYRMDDEEVRTYTAEYQERVAKALDIKPEDVRVAIQSAYILYETPNVIVTDPEARGDYRVQSADIALKGMTLTLHERHEARKLLLQMHRKVKPENVIEKSV